ncbi:MAG: SIS domain-containing protein [Alphaproteobacteria bacterium]
MSQTVIRAALTEAQTALQNLLANQETLSALEKAGDTLVESFKNGGRVFSCGNGGSMCDAMHFAEEFTGRYRKNRRPLPATAICEPGHITCVANDFGYDYIFSTYVEAHARAGDVLLAISTSGKSPNVLKAAEMAKQKGVKVIAMTGKSDCPLAALSDVLLATPGGSYADRVQELHIKMVHIMLELVERKLFPENYAA